MTESNSKIILLMRHAKAEELQPEQLDEARELTKAGEQQAKRVADFLSGQNLVPAQVLSSPYPRAQQSAELVLKQLQKSAKVAKQLAVQQEAALALNAPVKQFQDLLSAQWPSLAGVSLWVSHEPNISRYLSRLLASKSTVYDIKKASVTALQITKAEDSEQLMVKLLFTLPPKLMPK
ncbi:SixA phosphatase family protein [Pseudoalteromonas fenneropenaei]|uniref:SixA phosphatase family protein n=1 Tax=Pseudoalteromonas fenneropenaei TaxID=1737459 RepID=A0ABV7CEV6_9GAMM